MTTPSLPTTTRQPVAGLTGSRSPRVLTAGFGDGYIQRATDGINLTNESYSVTWEYCSTTDGDALDNFFNTQAGVYPFFWTPPGESATTPYAKKWICMKWSRTKALQSGTSASQTYDTITADFQRVYDQGT